MQRLSQKLLFRGPLVSASLPGIGDAAGPALKLVSSTGGEGAPAEFTGTLSARVSQRKDGYCSGMKKGRVCHQGLALRSKVSKLHKVGSRSWLTHLQGLHMTQLKRTKDNKITTVFPPCTLTRLAPSVSAVFLPCTLTQLAPVSAVFKPTKHINLPKVTMGSFFSREEESFGV